MSLLDLFRRNTGTPIDPIYLLITNSARQYSPEQVKRIIQVIVTTGELDPPQQNTRIVSTSDPQVWGKVNDPGFMYVVIQKLLESFPELEGYMHATPLGWKRDERLKMSTVEAMTDAGRFRVVEVTCSEKLPRRSKDHHTGGSKPSAPTSTHIGKDSDTQKRRLAPSLQQKRIAAAVDRLLDEGPAPPREMSMDDFKQVHVFTDRKFSESQIRTTLDNAMPILLGPSICDLPNVTVHDHVYPADAWPEIERYALETLMTRKLLSTSVTQKQLGWSKSTSILVLSVS